MRSAIAVLAALSVLPACLGPRVDASRYFTCPRPGPPPPGSRSPRWGSGR